VLQYHILIKEMFIETYIKTDALRHQNPAQNQAVRLVVTRSPPMFPPAIWNVHDATGRRYCREAPNQAAVSVAMMLVSGGRNIPGG
jgi:hypothetical protein